MSTPSQITTGSIKYFCRITIRKIWIPFFQIFITDIYGKLSVFPIIFNSFHELNEPTGSPITGRIHMFKVTMHYRITCATYFIYRKSLKGIIANFPGICTLRIFYGEIFFYSMKCKRNCYSALQRAKHFFMCHSFVTIFC